MAIQATATDAGTGSAPASGMSNVTLEDPEIAFVEFYANETLVGTDTGAPFVASWNNVRVGAHTLTAVAKDVAGNTATSAPITVTLTR